MGRAPGSFPRTPGPQERSKCGLGPIGNDKVTRTLLPRLRTISQWCISVNRECILCFAFACRHTCPNRTNPMRPIPSAGWRLGIHLNGGWDSQISQVAPISGGTELPGWVITPRIPGESATSEPGGKAEEISSKSDIAAGMSEPGAIADVSRRRL